MRSMASQRGRFVVYQISRTRRFSAVRGQRSHKHDILVRTTFGASILHSAMHYQYDNSNLYLNELLNVPIVHRCAELGLLIDRCSQKDLQLFFPQLVQSIFGSGASLDGGGGGGGSTIGWGLRTITGLSNAHEFDVLYSFFIPLGPMFRLCYRLLGDGIKFDVPVDILPTRTAEMLYTGRYAPFYADMLNIDPAVRQITSLSLNAFDYFILHFALHGLQPLHLLHPAAMDVHNEKRKTLYIYLVADYMCTFLPSHPDAVVLPSNVGDGGGSGGVGKMLAFGGGGGVGGGGGGNSSGMTPMHQPSIQPTRSPKYIKMSALLPHMNLSGANSPSAHSAPPIGFQSPNSTHHQYQHHHHHPLSAAAASASTNASNSAWRTESVLHLFVDTWLRCDVTAHLQLPSSEFVRAVRIAVKQLHAFANAADVDWSGGAMCALRSAVHPMINGLTTALVRDLIRRWPMDSSFSVVLELWLSFIQPWRYSFERIHGAGIGVDAAGNRFHNDDDDGGGGMSALPDDFIQRRFAPFVRDNLRSYTQILVQLLPRFERLNFASLKNVQMMSRLLKVFAQPHLCDMLRSIEFEAYATLGFMASTTTTTSQSSPSAANNNGSRLLSSSSPTRKGPSPMSASPTSPWNCSAASTTYRNDANATVAMLSTPASVSSTASANHTDDAGGGAGGGYVCMFGDDVRQQMRSIAERMLLSRGIELMRAAYLQADQQRQSVGGSVWRRWLRWLVRTDDDAQYALALADCRKIPQLLDAQLQQLQQIFDVEVPAEMLLKQERQAAVVAGGVVGGGGGGVDETMAGRLLDETDDRQTHQQSFDMSLSFANDGGAESTPKHLNSFTYTVDPAIIPARSYELTFLVRFLYQLSTKLNEMYHNELEDSWYRTDLVGRLARQVLSAPLVVHSFDKTRGESRVCEQRLRPRVNLRPLASYQAIVLVGMSFVVGQLAFGVPSFGFIGLLLLVGMYVFVLGLIGMAD